MADREEKGNDFYAVMGLKKECSDLELRNAYKKLALIWHPDRCSASGNSKFVEEAKKKFQDIQQAYSVLSDANKRFLYDVGAYESDDDENGMGDFLNEMAVMMSQTKPNMTQGHHSPFGPSSSPLPSPHPNTLKNSVTGKKSSTSTTLQGELPAYGFEGSAFLLVLLPTLCIIETGNEQDERTKCFGRIWV